jgi:hypothetical protein
VVTSKGLRWQSCPRCGSSMHGRDCCPCQNPVVVTRSRPEPEPEPEE